MACALLSFVSELLPVHRKAQPSFFVERVDRRGGEFEIFVIFLAEPVCIGLGRRGRIMHKVNLGLVANFAEVRRPQCATSSLRVLKKTAAM